MEEVARVSASKPVLSDSRKRKPYKPPALTKLTPEAAKKLLEAKLIPGDGQAEKLLQEINRRLAAK